MHAKLLAELARAVEESGKNRLRRLAGHPYKMAYPRVLRSLRTTRRLTAKTFWGEAMEVVLPEFTSISIWRYGYFENDVCAFLLHSLQKGHSFIDVGAHFGFFTLLGSRLVGETGAVLSLEPTPATFKLLADNVSGRGNVRTFNCAAFSRETELSFYDYGPESSAYNSLFGLRKPGRGNVEKERITVKAREIDGLVRENGYTDIRLVKIDAESSEMHVLEGMRETLKEHRPNLIVEVGDFGIDGVPESREIVSWLQNFGYRPYEVSRGGIVAHQARADYRYQNLLFMPER